MLGVFVELYGGYSLWRKPGNALSDVAQRAGTEEARDHLCDRELWLFVF